MRSLALAFALVALPAAAEPVSLRDVLRVVRLADPHISPDGKSIALVETHQDAEHDTGDANIVLVDIASHAKRPLTRDRHHAASPRWSPDGQSLAFLAPDGGKKLQIYVLPMAGGDASQITHAKDDVSQFAFSPDGKQIAFVTTDPAPERKGEDKFRDAFLVGNNDFLTKEKPRSSHIWLVPTLGGAARRLTSGDWSLPIVLPPGPPSSPVKFSKDGKSLIFVRQVSPATGDQFESRIQVLDIATGKIRDLTGATTLEAYPNPSPDGATIAYWRNRDARPWNFQDVWLAPFAGGPGQDISARLDKNIYGTWWLPGGKALLVGANDGTTVGLWKLTPEGAANRIDLGVTMPTNGYWVDADIGPEGEIAYIGQTATDPYELYMIANEGAKPAALTGVNKALASLTLGKAETVTWQSARSAKLPPRTLDGVLTYPPNYTQGTKYPLVLVVHGGPNSASRQRFSLLSQLVAKQGWLVFEPNYRGSDNQDNAFFAAIYQDAGQGPGEDVMAGVKSLQDRGIVDSARIAVTGWSYGGFMTTWLLGHYDIWKAAVAGAAVTDWVEMYDLSDGNVTVSEQAGGSPYIGDGMQAYRAQSPDSTVTKIHAPTLILCDVGDFRVPITQSYGLYRALHDNHVETQFYAYPVDGHFPGDPIRTMDVYQRWIDWLTVHLK